MPHFSIPLHEDSMEWCRRSDDAIAGSPGVLKLIDVETERPEVQSLLLALEKGDQ